jgi:hypothetical protein
MYLEEHAVNEARLPEGHPYKWMDDVIMEVYGAAGAKEHKESHERSLIQAGCDPEAFVLLSVRKKDGEEIWDRLYHCMLHFKQWKEDNIHLNHVKKFEEQSNFKLEELTMPSPTENFDRKGY